MAEIQYDPYTASYTLGLKVWGHCAKTISNFLRISRSLLEIALVGDFSPGSLGLDSKEGLLATRLTPRGSWPCFLWPMLSPGL